MTVFALIPARSGSKGVLDKNIKELGGHPLIAWSIEICKKSSIIDRIFVSTDSEKYADIAKDYGAEIPFIRPKNISQDNSTDYEFFQHFINWLDEKCIDCSYIAHMRPTSPLRNPQIIDKAIIEFKKSKTSSALRSVHKMSESAYKSFEISEKGQLKSLGSDNTNIEKANNPRQGFPETYVANGYIDIISTKYFRKNKQIHGDNVMPFITEITYEIDVKEDFELLEFQVKKDPLILNSVFS